MDFQLSEEHIAVRDAARDFAQNVLKQALLKEMKNNNFLKKKSSN